MSRASAARRIPQPVAIEPADFDRWRNARTEPAHSLIGYTPIDQLFEDFTLWASEALNIRGPIDEPSFRAAFENAPRPQIFFETLQCRAYYKKAQFAECASLRLREPIRSDALKGPY